MNQIAAVEAMNLRSQVGTYSKNFNYKKKHSPTAYNIRKKYLVTSQNKQVPKGEIRLSSIESQREVEQSD